MISIQKYKINEITFLLFILIAYYVFNKKENKSSYITSKFWLGISPEIVKKISKIKNLPSFIVQGRYDLICPPVNAYKLHENWKSSEIKFVNTAGHSSSDEGIIDNLLIGLKKLTEHL